MRILIFLFAFFPYCMHAQCDVWGNFKTTLKGNSSIQVWWENTEMRTTAAYQVEYSPDGVKFRGIDTLTGLQGYEGKTAYTAEHAQPTLGYNYYRIKRIMTNGDSCFSKKLVLFLDASGIQSAEMYPNPVHDYLQIAFFASRFDAINLTFYDTSGRVAASEHLPATVGKNVIFYNVQNVDAGVYSVELKNREVAIRHKIVVMK
jgi:Secretion system C-terminal sorting domain